MADDEHVDDAADASAALDEKLAGRPPRPMLSRAEANAKANAFFRDTGVPDVAISATPNPLQGLWVIGHHDPSKPDEIIDGGGPLIVPTSGPVYMSGSTPPWTENIGLEKAEYWTYESGEDLLPDDWSAELGGEFEQDYWDELLSFVAEERRTQDVFPPPSRTFAAFEFTSFADVRVVILGQDPYPNVGEAHGLAFSVPVGVAVPRSLQNIYKELQADLRIPRPDHGNLEGWVEQGVLLLNTALTVRSGSERDRSVHRKWQSAGRGWGTFTDAVIKAISSKRDPAVFILWGNNARKKRSSIDKPPHEVIESSHPSPLSERHSFVDSKPFSRTNEFLRSAGRGEIDWSRFESSR